MSTQARAKPSWLPGNAAWRFSDLLRHRRRQGGFPRRTLPKLSQTFWPLLVAAGALVAGCGAGKAEPAHALAMHGDPKHAAGFKAFPYVNADAPQGGRMVLGVLGTFGILKPFMILGVSAS